MLRSVFRPAFGLAALVTIAIIGRSAALAQAASSSSMFRASPDHAGVYADTGPRNLKTLKWRFRTRGKVRSSPAIALGLLCVGSEDGNLYALDAATGALRWKVQTGGDLSSSPAIAGRTVFVTGGDGSIYAIALETGRVLWTFETGRPKPYLLFERDPRTHDYWVSSPLVADGTVYVGSADGHVYALDAERGVLRWKHETGAAVRSSPALAGNRLYVGSLDGTLRAMDAGSGRLVWTFKTQGNPFFPAGEIQSSPAVVGDLVYVGARDGVLYAVDAATGRQRWASDHEMAWVNGSPAVTSQLVIVGDSDGESIVAVDARTGAERWRHKTNGRVFSSPAVAGDLVYVGNAYGYLYVLDLATGTVRDQGYGEAAFHSSPAVVAGVVYVGSDDSSVYAFEERPERRRIPVSVADAVLARYEGTYRFSPAMPLRVKARPNRIAVQMGDRPPFEMAAFGESEFFHEKADLQIRFLTDAFGQVTGMVFTQSGVDGRLAREK